MPNNLEKNLSTLAAFALLAVAFSFYAFSLYALCHFIFKFW